jgi:hydroxyethylthiazole kinase-like sugar kinase family protein
MGAANYVTGQQTVSYDATTHVLTLTGDLVNAKTGAVYSITDTETVDLSAKFGATMYVGFTGATAGADADQRITSFSVSSIGAVSAVPEADTYAMLMAGLGMVGWTARRRQRKA